MVLGGSLRGGAVSRGWRRARSPRWCMTRCMSLPMTGRRIGRRGLMAKRHGIGKDTVARIWRDHELKPWKVATFKISTDPQFEEKLVDVVGLYVEAPQRTVVFSFDEKTQCQGLDRTQPSLPMTPGRAGTMTHDYKRNGTTDLFAVLNVATGEVIHDTRKRHTGRDVLAFFKLIDLHVPRALDVHVVLDNLSAHKTPEIKKWLMHPKRARWHLHFTPTSSSWLNLIDGLVQVHLAQDRTRDHHQSQTRTYRTHRSQICDAPQWSVRRVRVMKSAPSLSVRVSSVARWRRWPVRRRCRTAAWSKPRRCCGRRMGSPTRRSPVVAGSTPTQCRWRRRFSELGVAGVGVIAKGRGRRSWLPEGTVAEVVRVTLEERLRRGVFNSVDMLVDAIDLWVEHLNDDPKPFIWHKTAQEIITKVKPTGWTGSLAPALHPHQLVLAEHHRAPKNSPTVAYAEACSPAWPTSSMPSRSGPNTGTTTPSPSSGTRPPKRSSATHR